MEGPTVTLQDIFIFKRTGYAEGGKVLGYHTATGNIPNTIQKLRKRGVAVDMSVFQPVKEK
jgi:pilus assembly protein CpaF